MKNFLGLIVISVATISCISYFAINPQIAVASDKDKILQAKIYILEFVSHPETVIFHDQCTIVEKNVVTLKFTYTNGFGIIDTLTMNIKVD